jgi:IclR family acetate operon transcriptional repressor
MNPNRELKEVKVKTVEKTLFLLELLADQNLPLSLTRIGQLSNLSISTVYRLLNTLCRSGFVERDKLTGHYKLGIKAFLIGNAALQKVELRQVALPHLTQLAKTCNNSVYLSIFSQQNVFYSDCIRTSSPIQIGIQTGIPIPACRTSSGRVLIAHFSLEEQLNLADFYYKNSLISDQQAFLKELAVIQKNGYSCDAGDFGGTVREFSAPIFDHSKRCVGAASIFGPIVDINLTEADCKIIQQLKTATTDISKALGCPLV